MAQVLDAAGDNRAAQILNQLWEILLGALEQMYDMLGDTHWEGEQFTRRCWTRCRSAPYPPCAAIRKSI